MRGRGVAQSPLCPYEGKPYRPVVLNNLNREVTFGSYLAEIRFEIAPPQQADSNGGNDQLCLYGLNEEDRGRVRRVVLIC